MPMFPRSFLLVAASAVALSGLGTVADEAAKGPPPQAASYTDAATGINFLSFSEPTGYRFGLAMASDAGSTTIIAQLAMPLASGGAGWTAVGFGGKMNGPLEIVAWPDGQGGVRLGSRVSGGYTVADTTVYPGNVVLTPIAKGTTVNATHLTATFMCAGCMDTGVSFTRQDASATFTYAYSSVAVQTPADGSTQLSDHTTAGEPYGVFGVKLADAQSPDYATWAAMAGGGSEGATTTGSAATTAATGSAESAAATGSAESAAATGSTAQAAATGLPAPGKPDNPTAIKPAYVVGLTVTGFIYVSHALNFF